MTMELMAVSMAPQVATMVQLVETTTKRHHKIGSSLYNAGLESDTRSMMYKVLGTFYECIDYRVWMGLGKGRQSEIPNGGVHVGKDQKYLELCVCFFFRIFRSSRASILQYLDGAQRCNIV